MLISLQTIFAADAHLAEGEVLLEKPTVHKWKSRKFEVGTLIPTVSSKEGQNLKPLSTLTRKGASKCASYYITYGNLGDLHHSHNCNGFEKRDDVTKG
jgi:hypothetical protein